MAVNAAAEYGLDIRCRYDADELFTELSGLALVEQDAFHSITSTDFLGEGAADRCFDVTSLLGEPADRLPGYAPLIEDVLTADDRIDSAEVTITPGTARGGVVDAELVAVCQTGLGPFTLTIPSIYDLSLETLEGQER